MNRRLSALRYACLLGIVCGVRPALAEGQPAGGDGAMREKILARFDKDGDGKLNDQERAAAKEAMQNRLANGGGEGLGKEELLRRFDKNGDGQLSDEERAAAKQVLGQMHRPGQGAGNGQGPGNGRELPPALKARLLQQFDKDGDGQLNEQERQAAMKHLQQMRSQGGPGGQRPGAKRGPNGAGGKGPGGVK